MIFAWAATSLVTVYLGLKLLLLLLLKLKWTSIFTCGLCSLLALAAFVGATAFFARLAPVAGFTAAVTYPYFTSIHALVLIICTVEDEHRGGKAFRQAKEITAERIFRAYFLMLLLNLVAAPLYIICYVAATDDDDENAPTMQFFLMLLVSVVVSMAILFTHLVYTLLYLDYKKRRDGK